ncbi:MAG: hypothetical protein KJ646_05040 [Nanoarchaeota archaeon]|nr:hypothetical protein [Nanoarchaeota archaeon]MBU4116242.1 hypothetical protein [Nanoarchaeota archaeon]
MKRGIIFCFVLLIIIYIFNINLLLFIQPVSSLTGSGITASVSFILLGNQSEIEIYSPLNTTYDFDIGDAYELDLNVSANFEVDNWWYSLYDVKHGELINDTIAFNPNTTFNAVRWSNELRVYAENVGVEIINENVTFFVSVPNSAPVFQGVNDSIFICENDFLNNYYFYVVDVDEQVLELALNPTNPFYLDTLFTSGQINTSVEMFSGNLDKSDIGVHEETVSVNDGEYSDSAYTNVTVIEVNNAPRISNIGVQTIWASGENSTFYKQVKVTDTEDGNQDGGVLNFSISFFDGDELFNISENGTMYFVSNSSYAGVYNIGISVSDNGIDNPAENIFEICGQDGGSITTTQNFSLTITDENRAPTITSNYPSNLSLNVSGTESLYFNISTYDPDGTIPDAYWYVNGVFTEYDSGNSTDEFSYNFGCNVSGAYTIEVEITDGLLNDSITWNIGVQQVACPVPPSGSSGGGGGGGGISCNEEWACESWETCQSIENLLELGILSGENYRIVLEQCFEIGLSSEFCGAQIRNCSDLSDCNTNYFKPLEFQSCHYTEDPNCNDGIKNCHDDSCEVLIDCGGPCVACPTCSDKIQNQGEEGIDCGGPCPWKCPEEIPLLKRKEVLYSFIALIILLILVATVKIIRIFKYKNLIAQE